MPAEFQKTKPSRLVFLAICYTMMAIVLSGRLFYWQVLRRDDVFANSSVSKAALAAGIWRGNIFDSHGHYLAVASVSYDVGASPVLITNKAEAAAQLAPALQQPVEDIAAKLSQNERPWVLLASNVPAANGQAVKDLGLMGITLDASPARYYPEGRLAAPVLGFVNHEQRAFFGLEQYYDSHLRGSASGMAGEPQVLLDWPSVQAQGNPVDLNLTIDRIIQHEAEQHLQDALSEYGALSGVIIVMDVKTGAVLAMAVAPSYDPNDFANVSSADLYINTAISREYEPGSVFKLITMAAALDAGVVRPTDTYLDEGKIEVGGRMFQNWDRKAYGETTMTELLAHSLNVGAVEIALKLGPERFYEAVRRFGFGEVTGIDLANEAAGSFRVPGTPYWSVSDLATNSFGQGLGVTPIQMVTAVAALANDGKLMRPYVVDRMSVDGQVVWQATPQAVRQVVAPEVAAQLTEMMVQALPQETPLAVVPNYTSAGKTGTAEVAISGRYDESAVIASFVGFLPARDPRLAILVKLDRPQHEAWGSRCAAPVWRSLAGKLCAYLGIPPDQASSSQN